VKEKKFTKFGKRALVTIAYEPRDRRVSAAKADALERAGSYRLAETLRDAAERSLVA
jgi:hypothetical protein